MIDRTSNPESRREYLLAHKRCQVCHIPYCKMGGFRFPMLPQVHHIVIGHRVDMRENFLALCSLCHGAVHNRSMANGGMVYPGLSLANVLWAKRDCDPTWYSPGLLAEIAHKVNLGVDPESLPAEYLTERVRWSGR